MCYHNQVVRQTTKYGGIAQLGERLNGIQEVSGSIPLISTKKYRKSQDLRYFFFVSKSILSHVKVTCGLFKARWIV